MSIHFHIFSIIFSAKCRCRRALGEHSMRHWLPQKLCDASNLFDVSISILLCFFPSLCLFLVFPYIVSVSRIFAFFSLVFWASSYALCAIPSFQTLLESHRGLSGDHDADSNMHEWKDRHAGRTKHDISTKGCEIGAKALQKIFFENCVTCWSGFWYSARKNYALGNRIIFILVIFYPVTIIWQPLHLIRWFFRVSEHFSGETIHRNAIGMHFAIMAI